MSEKLLVRSDAFSLPILERHDPASWLRRDDGRVLEFRLPWPPSVNDYWHTFVPKGWSRATVYVSDKAKDYREHVGVLCLGARQFGSVEIELDIVLHPPDSRRRDADNFNKGIWDALQAGHIFEDDAQVQSYRVTKGPVVKGGMVEVRIWERGKDVDLKRQG